MSKDRADKLNYEFGDWSGIIARMYFKANIWDCNSIAPALRHEVNRGTTLDERRLRRC